MLPTTELFHQLGVALLLGLLVGLEREKAAPGQPGMRTFPLITIFGTVCGILAGAFGGWVVGAGLIALAAAVAAGELTRVRDANLPRGSTTNVAVFLMYAVGAMVTVAPMPVAVAVGGSVAVLLQFKLEMHRFAAKLGDDDLRAVMQFVLLTCIILPVLPKETIDPFGVLSPFHAWLMVVLIVGLGLGGYIAYKFLGPDAGILLGGVLGGIISSTATTLSYARQVRADRSQIRSAALVIMIASTVAFARLLVAVAVISQPFFLTLLSPLSIMLVLTLVPSLVLWGFTRRRSAEMPMHGNPTELPTAVLFGLLYAIVLVGLAAGREYLGEQGMFLVATLSGLTDLDAITLSTTRLSLSDADVLSNGWRLIVAAALASLVAKALLAGFAGGWRMFAWLTVLFSIPFAGGLAMLLWQG